jgi:hypothetical protein
MPYADSPTAIASAARKVGGLCAGAFVEAPVADEAGVVGVSGVWQGKERRAHAEHQCKQAPRAQDGAR